MYNLNFNIEDNSLLVNAYGEVFSSDIINYVRNLEQFSKHTEKLYILQDSSNIASKIDLFDIPVIADEFEKVLRKFQFIKHADIHQLPSSTAYALVYQYNTQFPNYKYEIFNTHEAAGNWLMETFLNKALK